MSPTEGEPQLLYLEPDDEVTSVIRRLRGADAGRVVLVAPGRSRATSSVVALRLLSRAAADAGRSVALVADASTRALAGEAGIAAFASVAEATSPTPTPPQPSTPTRAPIHVVRGASPSRARATAVPPATDGLDETVAVHLPPPVAAVGRRRRPPTLPAWPWLAALLAVALAAGAALLPGATVRITPATANIGPLAYSLSAAITGQLTDELTSTKSGSATGERVEKTPATGVVTFFNWNSFQVDVPQGTQVSVGGTIAFVTIDRIAVPKRRSFLNPEPGQKSVGVVAVEPGTTGNVAALAIDTIDDVAIRVLLRAFDDNSNRLVQNDEATSGGVDTTHPVIQQLDIDAVVTAIEADLQQQLTDRLAENPDRLYAAPPETEVPTIEIRDELLGTEDEATFELTGTLAVDRPFGSRSDAEDAARSSLLTDENAAPAGMTILEDSITIDLGLATLAGERLDVTATVRAAAAGAIDEANVADRIAGLTVEEARVALAPLGEIEVKLWPGWLDRLPRLTFRISVETLAPSTGQSPSP